MRLYAVSDIHGNLKKFQGALFQAGLTSVENNWISKDAVLVICGDLIDRGPDSKGTVDYVIKLRDQAKQIGSFIYAIKGNHEQMLLDGINNTGWRNCWLINGGEACLESYGYRGSIWDTEFMSGNSFSGIFGDHIEFFKSMIPYAIVNKILFVHAGVNPKADISMIEKDEHPIEGKSHLWIRERFYNEKNSEFLKNYGVEKIVFGHTPTMYMKKDKLSMMKPHNKLDGKLLGIDTGSYYKNGCITVVEILEDKSHVIAGFG